MTNFTPDKYQYVEKHNKPKMTTSQVPDDTIAYLDRFKDSIQFLTFTVFKMAPQETLSRIRVYIPRRRIPIGIVNETLNENLAAKCQVIPCTPYTITNSFDVVLGEPMTLSNCIITIVKSLECYL